MKYNKLYLKKYEERRLKAGHLWIFSNEIDSQKSPLSSFKARELVQVVSHRDELLGLGYINPNTLIAVRMLTSDAHCQITTEFFIEKFQRALTLRQRFFSHPYYRFVFGEGDFLPGLVIDRFGDYFTMQIHTAGMQLYLSHIVDALICLFQPKGILLKSDEHMVGLEGLKQASGVIHGDIPEQVLIEENEIQYSLELAHAQKTGWYYDQRYNRKIMQKFVSGCAVLDAFCYVGSFALNAMKAGAKTVTCIDSSAQALEQVQNNARLNHFTTPLTLCHGDAFDELKRLKQENKKYDVVLLDPPAFMKKRKDREAGLIAYQKLQQIGVQLAQKDGILMTSSCSMHLSLSDFKAVLAKASAKVQRNIQIIGYGFQAADHPIIAAIPETEYLKTIICRVF